MKRCTCTCTFNPDCPVDHDAIAESLEAEINERVSDMSFSEKREWAADHECDVFLSRTKLPFREWLHDKIEARIEKGL